VAALKRILPAVGVLSTREQLRSYECDGYECDGLSAYRQLPLAVVSPTRVAEVQAVEPVIYSHGRCAGTLAVSQSVGHTSHVGGSCVAGVVTGSPVPGGCQHNLR